MAVKAWGAFSVIERPARRGRIWSRVGSAWLNGDGSITLVLDSFPVGGRVELRQEDRERANARGGVLEADPAGGA